MRCATLKLMALGLTGHLVSACSNGESCGGDPTPGVIVTVLDTATQQHICDAKVTLSNTTDAFAGQASYALVPQATAAGCVYQEIGFPLPAAFDIIASRNGYVDSTAHVVNTLGGGCPYPPGDKQQVVISMTASH